MQNTADLRTKGWELSLTWRDRIGAWGYNVGFNLYDSKTVVTKYHNESKIILKSDGTNNYYEGYEIGSIWGYVTDGYYTADDFEDTNTWKLKEGVVTVDGVSPRSGASSTRICVMMDRVRIALIRETEPLTIRVTAR